MIYCSKVMIFVDLAAANLPLLLPSKALRLPLHHLDKHFYVANWIEGDYAEFLEIQKSIVESPSWSIDDNRLDL